MLQEDELGIEDLDQKWVITAVPLAACIAGLPTKLTMLWRTEGPRGKPLPKVGAVLAVLGVGQVRVARIDPPGTRFAERVPVTLVIRAAPPHDDPYRDDAYAERDCDYCGTRYRGPAVYCSLRCAVADA